MPIPFVVGMLLVKVNLAHRNGGCYKTSIHHTSFIDQHSSMLNLTTRLAVNIRYLPEWEVDWSDTSPQRSRDSLTISDFLPTEGDAQQLRERAIHYTKEFLVTEFSSLTDLKCHVPSQQPFHPVQKTQVVPMSVLFKDELYKSETVEILTQYIADAQLSGDHQVT